MRLDEHDSIHIILENVLLITDLNEYAIVLTKRNEIIETHFAFIRN